MHVSREYSSGPFCPCQTRVSPFDSFWRIKPYGQPMKAKTRGVYLNAYAWVNAVIRRTNGSAILKTNLRLTASRSIVLYFHRV